MEPTTVNPSRSAPLPGVPVREADPRVGLSVPGMLAVSVGAHALVALGLMALPAVGSITSDLEDTIAIEIAAPPPREVEAPPPTPVPVEAPPPVEAARPRIARPVREVTPPPPTPEPPAPEPIAEPAPPAPAAPAGIAPPSIDDVFGPSSGPPSAMTAGSGAFAVAAGQPGGNGRVGSGGGARIRPSGPSELDRRRARRGYVHSLEGLVRAHVRYPRAAQREGVQGRVVLGFRVGERGDVLGIRVATTSGSSLLDDAALEAARELARVPAPPMLAALTAADEIRVPVVYRVQ